MNIQCNDGEVVGHNGRIGSFLLRATQNCIPVPKGVRPGTLSPRNTPIFVSVPATQVPSVIDKTIPNRRQDLVFVTNGIPSDFLNHFKQINEKEAKEEEEDKDKGTNDNGNDNDNDNGIYASNRSNESNDISINFTTSVPHFGVLKVGGDVISNKDLSPPTIIHGKHANVLQKVFTSHNLNVQIVTSMMDIDAAAIRKLLWVSGMWLLCHDNGSDSGSGSDSDNDESKNDSDCDNDPINVSQVHQLKQNELNELVEKELYPAAVELLEQYHGRSTQLRNASTTSADTYANNNTDTSLDKMGTLEEVMNYLKSYSLSMPNAIPNKALAIDEIDQRNGILLSTKLVQVQQPLHKALIERVVT